MRDDFLDGLRNALKIREEKNYEFRNVDGLTFAFMTRIVTVNGKISSAEIRPQGIIYEENGQYYFAPLDPAAEVEPLIKEFVRKCL